MIHGNTRITLRNPISGNIIKDIESENTFQSTVIAKAFRGLGSATSNPLSNSETRNKALWKNMVGGIFLFDKSIPSNSQYMPKGTKMTANGSYNVTNGGVPTELGSWNESESGASSSAITMVYDWNTSQGNGKIASVCLTSRVGGYIGYGNPSGGRMEYSRLKTFFEDKSLNPVNTLNNIEYAPRCIVGNTHFQFALSSEGALTVKKAHVPLSEASVFDWLEDSSTVDCSTLHLSQMRAYGFFACTDSGNIYLCPFLYGAINQNAKIYVWEVNPSTLAVTEIEITNNSGSDLSMYGSSVSQGKLFVHDRTTSNAFVFNLSNNNYLGQIPLGTTWATGFTSGNVHGGFTALCCGLNGSIAGMVFYDDVNNTGYPTNGVDNSTESFVYDSTTDSLYLNGRHNLLAFNSPLYLATINNITEVIKDATLSMKVRYTLSES